MFCADSLLIYLYFGLDVNVLIFGTAILNYENSYYFSGLSRPSFSTELTLSDVHPDQRLQLFVPILTLRVL